MTASGPAEPLPPSVPPPGGPTGPRRGNGVGLAALVVGIVAMLLAVLPSASVAAFLPALAAIVLGIVGLVRQGRSRGTSVAGLVLGGIALLTAIVLSAITVIGIATRAASRGLPTVLPSEQTATGVPPIEPTGSPTPGLTLAPGAHTVVYTITGAGTATVNYTTFAGGDTEASSGRKRPLPFRRSVVVHLPADQRFASFTTGATQLNPEEPVACTITVDGEVVSTKRSTSTTLAFVFCTARTGP